MSNGNHTISVHARDAAGNWGAVATVTFVVDKARPTVTVSASPNPRRARRGDPHSDRDGPGTSSGISRVEWWRGTEPGRATAP